MGQKKQERAAVAAAGRVLELQKEGERDADFARRVGIAPQMIIHYRNGGGASLDVLAEVARRARVSANWLLDIPEPGQAVLRPVTPQELDDLAGVLGVASGMVEALRARYEAERPQPEATPAPAPDAVRARVLGRRAAVLRKARPAPEGRR